MGIQRDPEVFGEIKIPAHVGREVTLHFVASQAENAPWMKLLARMLRVGGIGAFQHEENAFG